MTCRTLGLWRAGQVLAAVMAMVVLGCGGGGGDGDSTGGATPASETSAGHPAAKNGRIVIVGEDGATGFGEPRRHRPPGHRRPGGGAEGRPRAQRLRHCLLPEHRR